MSEILSGTNVKHAMLQVGSLLDQILIEVKALHPDFEKLDYYKKQLSISESRINSLRQNGEEPADPIKSRRIKLVLKIDEIESAINAVQELMKVARKITREFKEFEVERQSKKKSSVLLDQFNNKQIILNSASRSFKLLSEKVYGMELSELANVINEACGLKRNAKVYTLHKKLVTKNDLGFHDAFFSLIKAKRLSTVLKFSNVEKRKFTLSEMLSYYVNYTLNRDSMEI